jgi:hypothetical protein
MSPVALRTVTATRYVAPLREGGSLPALVEADDLGFYVVKLRGAGQGPLALVAEVVAGELARALGLPVPDQALVELDVDLSRAEPDPEIQELLQASAGTNVGLDLLPGSLPYAPATKRPPPADLAARVVWFDALVENVDRTPRNPNLLVWHGDLWLIDHGAALFRQHAGLEHADPRTPFAAIAQHVLLPVAGSIEAADAELAGRVDRALVTEVVGLVPDEWLAGRDRGAYVEHLVARMAGPRPWVAEAERARRAVQGA